MLTPGLGAPARFTIVTSLWVLLFCLTLCLALAGCASPSSIIACGGSANGGSASVPVCLNPNPLLYASTASNQILPFSISNASGAGGRSFLPLRRGYQRGQHSDSQHRCVDRSARSRGIDSGYQPSGAVDGGEYSGDLEEFDRSFSSTD